MRKLGSFVVFVEEFLTDCNYDRVVVSNMCLFSLLGVLGELFFYGLSRMLHVWGDLPTFAINVVG